MSPGTSLDPAAVRDRLTTELRRGAADMQLVGLEHGGLRRSILPVDVLLADGTHTSNLGGFLEVLPGAARVHLRGMVLDHVASHSVSFRVVDLQVQDPAGADLAAFLIGRTVDEEAIRPTMPTIPPATSLMCLE